MASKGGRFAWMVTGLGLAVPASILMFDYFSTNGWWPSWIVFIWPGSFMLGAVSGRWDSGTLLVLSIAVLSNVVLYGLAGALIGRFLRWSR